MTRSAVLCSGASNAWPRSTSLGYERIRNVSLKVEPFTVENNLLTRRRFLFPPFRNPAFANIISPFYDLKLKRPLLSKLYRSLLDQLYEQATEQSPLG